jgi:uncharacterized membrane protein
VSSIERAVVIDAPAAAVWAVLEDVRRLPEFSASTLEVRDAPERLTAPGQTYVQVGRILGKKYASTWRVVALEPGRLIRSEGSLGFGVHYCLTQHVEPVGAGSTRLGIVLDYAVPGGPLGRLAAKAGIEGQAAREAQAVLDGIQRVVQADAAARSSSPAR